MIISTFVGIDSDYKKAIQKAQSQFIKFYKENKITASKIISFVPITISKNNSYNVTLWVLIEKEI